MQRRSGIVENGAKWLPYCGENLQYTRRFFIQKALIRFACVFFCSNSSVVFLPLPPITKGEGIWAAQSFRAQNALFPPSGILLCQNENKGQYTFVPEPVLPDSRFMGIFQIAFWHAMQWRPPLHAMRAFAKGFPLRSIKSRLNKDLKSTDGLVKSGTQQK